MSDLPNKPPGKARLFDPKGMRKLLLAHSLEFAKLAEQHRREVTAGSAFGTFLHFLGSRAGDQFVE